MTSEIEGPAKGDAPVRHLVEHAAECPDVRTSIHREPSRLLRAHVSGRAKNQSRLRDRRHTRVRLTAGDQRIPCETEIEDLGDAVRRELDVGGFEIAMDDAALVRRVERVDELTCDRDRLVDREFPLRPHPRVERLPLDQLHHDGGEPRPLLQAVDGRNIRVVERRQNPRFALEPCEPVLIRREQPWQNLDRDLAMQLGIARAVDLAHAACAQLREDLIGTESCADIERHRLRSAPFPSRARSFSIAELSGSITLARSRARQPVPTQDGADETRVLDRLSAGMPN